MAKTESVLRFNDYTVKEVNFKSNDVEINREKSWNVNFEINSKIQCNDEKKKMTIELSVEVFKGVQDAPFYINATIVGHFEMLTDDDIVKFKPNAIAIMYPYLRAIISTYTSAANVMPIILPAINVNAMLQEQENKNK